MVVLEAETIGAFTQASSINSGIVETFEDTGMTSFASPELLLSRALRDGHRGDDMEKLLCAGSVSIYEDFHEWSKGCIGLEWMGMLEVIDREEDYAKALEVYGQKQIVGQKELRQLEPSLSLHLLGAVRWPTCLSLNPLKTMLALLRATCIGERKILALPV